MMQQQRPSYQPPPAAMPLVQRHSYTPPPVSISQQRPSYTPPPGVVASNHLVMPNMIQSGCPMTAAPMMAPQQQHSYVPPPAASVVQSNSYVPPVQPLPGFAPPPAGGGSLHMP